MYDQTPRLVPVAGHNEETYDEGAEEQREKVRSFFDGDEGWQGKLYSARNDRFARAVARRRSYLLHMLASANEPRGGNALDIGCGSGSYMEELARLGFTVYGMDSSGEMVRCAKRTLGNRASVLCGDSESIPFKSGQFDVVLCVGVLGYLLEDATTLSEMHRVLKPDGLLMVNVENMMSFSNIDYVIRRRLRRDGAGFVGNRQGRTDPEATFTSPWVLQDPRRRFRYKLYNPWAFEVLMNRSGFTLVDSMTFGIEFRILRRFKLVPESWLLRWELIGESLMRRFRVPYFSYLGESYNALFQKQDEVSPVRSSGRPDHFRGGISGSLRHRTLAGDGRNTEPRGIIPTE